jgi:hypothetical protein
VKNLFVTLLTFMPLQLHAQATPPINVSSQNYQINWNTQAVSDATF